MLVLLFFEFGGGEVPDGGVNSLGVIICVDVLEDRDASLFDCGE